MTEVLIDYKDKNEADGFVTEFLDSLTLNEQKEFLAFMKGFQFAKGIEKEKKTVALYATTKQTIIKQNKQMSIFDLETKNEA